MALSNIYKPTVRFNPQFFDRLDENESKEELIDFSSSNLKEFPSINMEFLKCLYLENNEIKDLPEDMFTKAQNLKWLDLRNNQITEIPSSIKYHTSLETILLQNNKITRLPSYMCTVKNLKHLQLAGNPINFPNKNIIKSGTDYTLKFLKFYYDREPKIDTLIENVDYNNSQESSEETADETNDNKKESCISILKCRESGTKGIIFDSSEIPKKHLAFYEDTARKCIKENNFSKNKYGEEKNFVSKKNICLLDNSRLADKGETRKAKSVLFKHFNSNKYVKRSKVLSKSEQTIKIFHTAIEEKRTERKKELLNKREKALQNRKSLEALKRWRDKYKVSKENNNVIYYTLDLSNLPYDTDLQHVKILTRADIEKDLPDKYRKNIRHKCRMSSAQNREKVSLQSKILEVKDFMKAIKLDDVEQTPRTKLNAVSDEIKKLTDLRKKIVRLKVESDNNLE